jgi:hypothetical protein
MDDLIAFLGARLDAIANGGRPDQHEKMCGYDQIEFEAECDCDVPKAVLADIAAKRQIIEVARAVLATPNIGWVADAMKDILKFTALPFASHPDYRAEWRV